MSAHKYELMFIADPELDERGAETLCRSSSLNILSVFADGLRSEERRVGKECRL